MCRRILLPCVIAWVALGIASQLHAATDIAGPVSSAPTTRPEAPTSFMRFVDDNHGGGSLQAADVTFRNSAGATVDLVGAVHIGEKAYYEALNRDFRGFDAVLYELVKSKETAVPAPGAGENSSNPISQFQHFLKNALELDFQLDDIDYTAPNFVHADMDKETFEQMQEERGESFPQLMLKQLMNAFTQPAPQAKQGAGASDDDDSLQEMVKIFTRPDMERQIKVVIARQLGDMDTAAMGLDGPDGSVILTERNKAAMKVLEDTLASGKRHIAIFYGAAHMPDMTKRLEAMGFSPVAVHWNQAWDLTIRVDQPSAVETLFNNLLKSTDDGN